MVALIGHNGAGKSTLLKLILGLTRPDAGSVRLWGEDPGGRAGSRMRVRLGYLPEAVAFDAEASGRALIRFYASLKGLPRSAGDGALASVGLAGAGDRPVRTYSKGMRQRLGLAQAVLGDPDLLVLDEPTTGLDPVLRDSLYERTAELRRRKGAIVLSSHALSEIEEQADRFVVMRGGRGVAAGSLPELRRAAALPVRILARLSGGTTPAEACERVRASVEREGARVRLRDEGTVEVLCPPRRKLPVLRELALLDLPLADIELREPGLEELYAHFSQAEDASCGR